MMSSTRKTDATVDREWDSVTPKRRNSLEAVRIAQDMMKSIRNHFKDYDENDSDNKSDKKKGSTTQKNDNATDALSKLQQQEEDMKRNYSCDTLSTLDTTTTSLTASTAPASGRSITSTNNNVIRNTPPSKDISPVQYMLQELNRVASSRSQAVQPVAALSGMDELFEDTTPEQKAAYDTGLIRAIRNQDIPTLHKLHFEQGRTLQAANNFGESVLHMACRRGFLKVVKFLLEEANVHLWLRDDTGRTPLHDACWTATPNLELVNYLIEKDRDLLLVKDKRGHLPFDYVRKNDWDLWVNKFLYPKDMSTLYPRRNIFVTATASIEQEIAGLESELAELKVSERAQSHTAAKTKTSSSKSHIPQIVKVGST